MRKGRRSRSAESIANDIEVHPSTRTDPEIARDVQQVLKSHVMLGEMKITATVQEGFVTLEGTVEWNFQKTSAVDAAESVRGVRGVINLISVKPAVSATSVKNDIEAALRRSAELDARNIQISAALAAPGIGSVVNQIIY